MISARALVLCLPAACGPNVAPPAVETVRIPLTVSGEEIELEAFVYEPGTPGRHSVAIFNHGSAAGDPEATHRAQAQAEYFVGRGFVVVVPMRRGRGTSGGVTLEGEEKNCDLASWEPGLAAAYDDLTAAIDFAAKLPTADPSRIVLAGASRGGFLSVAYAARGARRNAIVGVVNFSGGWVAQAVDQCPIDFNEVAFRSFGAEASAGQLWLYGTNDPFYGDAITRYPAAFEDGGGEVRFELVDGVPGNGHLLVAHPNLWRASVDTYLTAIEAGRTRD